MTQPFPMYLKFYNNKNQIKLLKLMNEVYSNFLLLLEETDDTCHLNNLILHKERMKDITTKKNLRAE